MKFFAFAASVVLATVLTGQPAAAEDQEPLIILRDSGSYPPYDFRNEAGQYDGIHGNLLEKLAELTGTDYVVKDLPWKRAMAMVRTGQADILMFVRKNPEREAYLDFVEGSPMSYVQHSYYVRRDRQEEILFDGTVESLRPYVVGVMRGFSYGEPFDSEESLKKDPTDGSLTNLVKKLENGRVDISVLDLNIINYMKRTGEIVSDLQPVGLVSVPAGAYMAISKESPNRERALEFVRYIPWFKQTHHYREILGRYQLPKDENE
ncbi:substrate-binding periplasmic protein [Kiloniella sp. b19]|uniref:substrate-binding periplasmic protein n=1 Tax=Kiloniella sp. GXU_MW_B19 TaxID=3141326 RepID=UPI0031D631E6